MDDRRPSSALQRLLTLRRFEEERKTGELVRARRLEEAASEIVQVMRDRRSEIRSSLGDQAASSVGRVQTLNVLLDHVDAGLRNALGVELAASGDVREREEAFLIATRDREAIERVVRDRSEHAKRQREAIEQKLLDEIALERFRANGGEML